ncbi:S26 family signal peptidase [Bradyrhizobium sp. Arg68]|uniref:S26 family signal peptidase n=1 Tax=Bradyrhizobium ivorense TaxID=2511166 RepID=UPI001E428DF2|nr:S26 family signal peptidase [Bradyrhizobium ivorense]MCC8937075.1 S26 family signal peptidase [Bradyrhizobium ivorense]
MRIDARQSWRGSITLLAMCLGITTVFVSYADRTPRLLFNASASAPRGFYYLDQRLPLRGELAVLSPPPAVALLIIANDIMPAPLPLLKQVVAVGGEEVCRTRDPADAISIGGKVIAEVETTDHAGRPLPSWEGCLRLVEGEYFLMQPHPRSFDSRYFGPVLRCDILGVAKPIWTWASDE